MTKRCFVEHEFPHERLLLSRYPADLVSSALAEMDRIVGQHGRIKAIQTKASVQPGQNATVIRRVYTVEERLA